MIWGGVMCFERPTFYLIALKNAPTIVSMKIEMCGENIFCTAAKNLANNIIWLHSQARLVSSVWDHNMYLQRKNEVIGKTSTYIHNVRMQLRNFQSSNACFCASITSCTATQTRVHTTWTLSCEVERMLEYRGHFTEISSYFLKYGNH